jgi:hypothetical protein
MAIKYNPMLPIPQTTLRSAPTFDQLVTNRLARQASVRKPPMPMPQGNMARDIDMARQKREMQMRILQAQAAQAQKQRQQVQAQQQQQQKQGGFQMPSAMSPAGQALGAAAATGLQLSGYSTMPRTFGQNIGAMMASADKAYRAAVEQERQRKLEEAPQFMTVGDTLYRVQGGEIINAYTPPKAAKTAEIKAEGAQVRLKDGRIVDTVYDKYNNMYPIGVPMTEENQLKTGDYSTVNKYTAMDVNTRYAQTKGLRELEKPIKLIDSLASSIIKLDSGGLARAKRSLMASLKNSAPETFGEMSDQELETFIITGKLTSLVGQSRLALFGPGVLTAPEAAMARAVFIGADDVSKMNPDVAMQLLSSIRSDMADSYTSQVDYFNSFEGNNYQSNVLDEPIFDWNAWSQGEITQGGQSVPVTTQQPSVTTTAGGNTFKIN